MSKNPLLHTLIAMTGQDNVITVHRPFVEFTGTLEAAMMLSQLLYWTPRSSMGGWVAKSDKEWNDELCLTRYSIRTATTTLEDMEIIETKLKKFNGAPTKHYLVKWDVLERTWTAWLEKQNRLSEIEQSDCAKADNSQSEIRQSLTETTAKTTQKEEGEGEAFRAFEQNIQPLTVMVRDDLGELIDEHTPAWVIAAIKEAALNGKRSIKYIRAILDRWKVEGYGTPYPKKNGNGHKSNESPEYVKPVDEPLPPPRKLVTPEMVAQLKGRVNVS